MVATPLPVSVERLVRQIGRVDAERAALKDRLGGTTDESAAHRIQREMAGLKNRRVTLAGELGDWLTNAPAAQRALVQAALQPWS